MTLYSAQLLIFKGFVIHTHSPVHACTRTVIKLMYVLSVSDPLPKSKVMTCTVEVCGPQIVDTMFIHICIRDYTNYFTHTTKGVVSMCIN